jgi:O-acetyl-ADP-ribose deacetylase (regulator of RNase III)
MIQYISGNLFTSNAKVLVNTVNTVGVMGKGIASDFKKYYPKMFEEYKHLCDANQLNIGDLNLYKTSNKWILNFPTKEHWRSPSKIEFIGKGLQKLVADAHKLQINDIAMPKLGCGNGGLDWESEVKPIVDKYLKKSPINVSIYEFDKDIIPEHLTPKDIEEWLLSEPENLSFKLFFEDLLDLYKQKTLFIETLELGNSEYIVNYNEKEELFAIQSDKNQFILSKEDIKTMFFTLKNRGKLCAEDIAHELYGYRDEIFDFFTKLNYVLKNEDKIILNYTEKADISSLEILDEL